MKRASNTFTLAEISALKRICSAADRRDMDTAQRYAQTPAAISARGKLQRMHDRCVESGDEPEVRAAFKDEPRPIQHYKRVKWGASKGEA